MIEKSFLALGFIYMITMNALANALPINGKLTGELSDLYPNLFVPVGLTFSIWGIIYLLLLIAVLKIVMYAPRLPAWHRLFLISCILNGSWIVAWHYQYMFLSLAIMTGLLISLIYIIRQLSGEAEWLYRMSFGIYLGWICIATIANVTAALVYSGFTPAVTTQEGITIFMLFVALGIIVLSIRRFNNPFMSLSVIWAYLGIYLKQAHLHPSIAYTAIIMTAFLTILTAYGTYKNKLNGI